MSCIPAPTPPNGRCIGGGTVDELEGKTVFGMRDAGGRERGGSGRELEEGVALDSS